MHYINLQISHYLSPPLLGTKMPHNFLLMSTLSNYEICLVKFCFLLVLVSSVLGWLNRLVGYIWDEYLCWVQLSKIYMITSPLPWQIRIIIQQSSWCFAEPPAYVLAHVMIMKYKFYHIQACYCITISFVFCLICMFDIDFPPWFDRLQPNMKCIIFVNRILTARSLSSILQSLQVLSVWKCDFLVGVHSGLKCVSRKSTNAILAKFRSGEVMFAYFMGR